MNHENAVVVLSGGQDSTTCLFWALNKFKRVYAISFFYGQKHSVELDCAKALADKHGIPHKLIDISFLGSLVDSALTNSLDNNEVTEAHPRIKDVPASYVPNRNTILLTLSHAYAQTVDAKHIITGITTSDFWEFKDMTSHWLLGFLYGSSIKMNIRRLYDKNTASVNTVLSDDVFILNKIVNYFNGMQNLDYTIEQIYSNAYGLVLKNYDLVKKYIYDPDNEKFIDLMIEKYFKDDCKTLMYDLVIGELVNTDNPPQKELDFITGYVESKYFLSLDNIKAEYELFGGITTQSAASCQQPGMESIIFSSYLYEKFFRIIYPHTRTITMRGKIDKAFFLDTDINIYGAAYPDCTPQFRHSIEKTLNKGSKCDIIIHAPLQYLNKSLIFGMAEYYGGLQSIIEDTHTCYNNVHDELHNWGYGCGSCPSCVLRKEGYLLFDKVRYTIKTPIYNPNIYEVTE